MPIKLPRTFARRKSSGNVLDDVESTPQSSFRVFERPGGPQRSMTDGNPLPKRMSESNLVLSHLESNNMFAGTERPMDKPRGGTYESSTSTRLSSSSTLPSSTEISPPDEAYSPHSRIHDIPAPPPLSGALRAAGRTFSFGGRFRTATPPAHPQHNVSDASAKPRGTTSSSDSTALPPKLPDTSFDLGTGADDFQNMFDNVGKRPSSPGPSYQYSSSSLTHQQPQFETDKPKRPAPINTDRSIAIQPSPNSWDRHHSEEDGLLGASGAARSNSPTEKQSSPSPTTDTTAEFRGPSPSNRISAATTSHRSLERGRGKLNQGLQRSGVYPERRDSEPIDDEDAKLVRQSLLWSKETSPHWAEGASTANEPSLTDKGKTAAFSEYLVSDADNMFSDRQSPVPTESSSRGHVRLAVQFAEDLPKPASPGNKVMTPSQFERYRQQQELRRSNSSASQSDEESVNDEYDEEDEVEKQREAERQRRKQEARLSVYRQQMTKMTGQQAASSSLRPVISGPSSSSTPNLLNRLSNSGDKSASGKSSEDDDEEVPLGILAAHGFPNRNRPPTRLTNVGSNPNLRASAMPYISSASSVTGAEQDMNNRKSLPVFARNLPKDPYFGAGLVDPSNRESLALGGGSVYGGPSSPMPPGGLVGVIASEERARAMRRGSPNTQAMYEQRGVPRSYSMMPQQQGVSATEQAQLQLSQQMAHMMQMQMQWMQQMMQMQGIQDVPPMMKGGMPMPAMMGAPPMPGMPTSPPPMAGGNANMRPMSMHTAAVTLTGSPHVDQRTLSALDPNIMRQTGSPMPPLSRNALPANTPGYAPSIAPSERTNMGMASRYRPVSIMQDDTGHLTTSSMSKPWNDENHHKSLPVSSQPRSPFPKSTSVATVTVRPVSTNSRSGAGSKEPPVASDDEDEDQGWAEMMKKRDKKKSSWKIKRGTSSFGDLLSVVH